MIIEEPPNFLFKISYFLLPTFWIWCVSIWICCIAFLICFFLDSFCFILGLFHCALLCFGYFPCIMRFGFVGLGFNSCHFGFTAFQFRLISCFEWRCNLVCLSFFLDYCCTAFGFRFIRSILIWLHMVMYCFIVSIIIFYLKKWIILR